MPLFYVVDAERFGELRLPAKPHNQIAMECRVFAHAYQIDGI